LEYRFWGGFVCWCFVLERISVVCWFCLLLLGVLSILAIRQQTVLVRFQHLYIWRGEPFVLVSLCVWLWLFISSFLILFFVYFTSYFIVVVRSEVCIGGIQDSLTNSSRNITHHKNIIQRESKKKPTALHTHTCIFTIHGINNASATSNPSNCNNN